MAGRTEAEARAYKREYYLRNREKIKAYGKARYEKNKEKITAQTRGYRLRTKFFPNLTDEQSIAEYARMLNEQRGCCAICGQPERKKDPQNGKVCDLAVDHCRATGKVRGLLCFVCNTNLGRFERYLGIIYAYLSKNNSLRR